jgi:hypothetical protein
VNNIKIYILLLLSSISWLIAQDHILGPEANNWYFGEHSGITFNTADKKPIAVHSDLVTEEGTAAISDELGNLLFYAQGDKIWNKKHELMLNGSGLLGGSSATQAVLIVQQPSNNYLFFVFTTCNLGGPLYYSIVDLGGDNGFGEVIKKNVKVYDSCAEKLVAIVHSNQTDIWIAIKEQYSYNFRSYLLTSIGLTKDPVISKFNLGYDLTRKYSPMGYLAVSPDGSRIAAATYSASQFELYDFSNKTGELSNAIELPLIPKENNDYIAYGVCFSPDGTKLYCSNLENNLNTHIFQFDLISGSRNEILKSKQIIASSFNGYMFGAIQAAPDGKLYISKYLNGYLSVINNPDARGAKCEFVEDGVYLDGTLCRLGLPNFAFQKLYLVDKPDPKIHKSLIRINSAKGRPGDVVELPIFAKLLTDTIIGNHLSYDITLEFNASAFLPDLNLPEFRENIIQNGVRILKFNGLTNGLTNSDIELFRLKGTILLGEKPKNEVKISDFSWSDTTLVAFLESGEIIMNDVCKSDLRKVTNTSKVQIELLQTVVSDLLEVNIKSSDETNADISVYSLIGNRIISRDIIIQKSEQGIHHNFDLKKLSSGYYYLIITTASQHIHRLTFIKY